MKNLVAEIRKYGNFDDEVIGAIESIDREVFVPKGLNNRYSYTLDALPLPANQWISSPLTVAKMSMALQHKNADSVLEIGCGSGYQAAVLSKLFRRVFTIERIERLLTEARNIFKSLRITNINTRFEDGMNGWREFAPYDRILLSASTDIIPNEIFNQLSKNGILVAPIEKNGKQVITRFTKKAYSIDREEIGECKFVSILSGIDRG
jgi:protein-L-isoaspartate(D-aspartate) O-methyltransferase